MQRAKLNKNKKKSVFMDSWILNRIKYTNKKTQQINENQL